MSPEFTLSHILKIQLIIRAECFYIVLRNKEMYSLITPILQFFHHTLKKLPGNSLILEFPAYSHPGDLR